MEAIQETLSFATKSILTKLGNKKIDKYSHLNVK